MLREGWRGGAKLRSIGPLVEMKSVIELSQKTGSRSRSRRGQGGGLRITSRDLEIVSWLGRVRFATRDQIARRFDLGRSQGFHRIAQLRKAGFVDERPLIVGPAPSIVFATRRGLIAAGSDLRPADLDGRSLQHDGALVDLAIDYEQAGAVVLTDRELRSLARRPESEAERYAVEVPGSPGRRHFPDLIVEADGRRLAVELEVAEKTISRLRGILSAYRGARLIDGVLYLATKPVVVTRINRLIEELAMEDLAEVRLYGDDVR